MTLHEIQKQFYQLATAPENVSNQPVKAQDIEQWLVGDTRMSAIARLDVYANMYFFRILDVLREQFEGVLNTIGEDFFHNLITDYLQVFPPTHFSIGHAGARLAEYLQNHALLDKFPHLADLASLEWQYVVLFDGPDAQPLTLFALQQIAPEDYGDLPLRFIPCHTLLKINHAIDHDHAASPQTLLVWRQDRHVRHRSIDALEERAMQQKTFGDLCEWLCELFSEEEAPARAFALLKQWIDDALLAAD